MKLTNFLNTDIRSLVLFILIPILSLLIIFISWSSYNVMYKTIILGFNHKLVSISSTSGSFIDGDKHEKLAEGKTVKALTVGEKGELYGIDHLNYLLQIDKSTGAGNRLFQLDRNINDMTYDKKKKIFYVTSGNTIFNFTLNEKNLKPFYKHSTILKAIAYDSVKEQIYLGVLEGLGLIDKNRNFKIIQHIDYRLDRLTLGESEKYLYGVDQNLNTLIKIDLEKLKARKLYLKDFYVDTTPVSTIAYENNKLYYGSEHLAIYDQNLKTTTYEDFARGYRDENSDIYKEYIAPMTKIKLETGLTYHYTQNLVYGKDDANCIYILDVSEGNEYTPIGSEDVMDNEAIIGAENVMLRKDVYVSKIQEWEQWGLLKVAFAPIVNKDGVVKAIAGADVDMGIIRKKTKEVLIQSIIAGIIFLIISIVAAFSISKKIIEPIRKLKYSALKIAAGHHDEKVLIEKPQELSDLSDTFNTMGTKLKDTVLQLTQYNSDVSAQRKEQDLQVKLDQRAKVEDERIKAHIYKCTLAVNGFLLEGDLLYFWFSDKKLDTPFVASKERELISTSLRIFIHNESDPFSELKAVYKDLESFGFIDLSKQRLHLHEESKKLGYLIQNKKGDYISKVVDGGEILLEANAIFGESGTLENISKNQIDLLMGAKYSHLDMSSCSILFGIVTKGKSWN